MVPNPTPSPAAYTETDPRLASYTEPSYLDVTTVLRLIQFGLRLHHALLRRQRSLLEHAFQGLALRSARRILHFRQLKILLCGQQVVGRRSHHAPPHPVRTPLVSTTPQQPAARFTTPPHIPRRIIMVMNTQSAARRKHYHSPHYYGREIDASIGTTPLPCLHFPSARQYTTVRD
jgi:hypothetical protein